MREFDEFGDLLLARLRCDRGAPPLQRRSGVRCEADHLLSFLGLNGGAPAVRGEEEVVDAAGGLRGGRFLRNLLDHAGHRHVGGGELQPRLVVDLGARVDRAAGTDQGVAAAQPQPDDGAFSPDTIVSSQSEIWASSTAVALRSTP